MIKEAGVFLFMKMYRYIKEILKSFFQDIYLTHIFHILHDSGTNITKNVHKAHARVK